MNIQEILSEYKIKERDKASFPSERHEIISRFSKKINENRIRDGLKILSSSFLNKKMAENGLKTNFDLYKFYKYCEEAKNFDKCWWWSLRSKK